MNKEPGRPFSDNTITSFLEDRLDKISHKKSQREIAFEMGLDKPNIISMYKRGNSKIPIDRIPALAKAIEVDVALLFRLAIKQYWPNMDKTVDEIFGEVFTENERELVLAIREATNNTNPKISADKIKKITAIIS